MSNETKKRHIIRKLLKWLGLATGGLSLLVAAIASGAFIWLGTDSGGRFIAAQLTDMLKAQGLFLKFDEFSGPLPGNIKVKGIELADEQGVWLRAEELGIELTLTDLLSATLTVDNFSLIRPELVRLPVLPESPAEPEPLGSEPGFDLNLPVSIALNKLSIRDADIAWSVLGLESSEGDSLLNRATRQRLIISVDGEAKLAKGEVDAYISGSLSAGDVLGLDLALDPAVFNKPDAATMEISTTANAAVHWNGRSDNLKITAELKQNGSAWSAPDLKIAGLGLNLATQAEFDQTTNHIEIGLNLKGEENAEWQSLAAELAGLEQSFMAAVGNPLSIQLNAVNSESGAFNLDLTELQAGIISGQGKSTAHFPESADLPAGEPGSVDADFNIRVSDLALLSPQLGGELQTSIKASGNFKLANIDISVSSSKLLIHDAEINDLSVAVNTALHNVLDDSLSGSGSLHASSASVPVIDSGNIAMSGDWKFALNRTPGMEYGSASLDGLSVQAFGANLSGQLDAQTSNAFFAAKNSGALWPAGLSVNGNLDLDVGDWSTISQLAGMQINGTGMLARIQLQNSGTQILGFDLSAKSLALPQQNVKITGLNTRAEAKFSDNEPDLSLNLQTTAGMADLFEWSSLTAKVDGNAGQGQFVLNMLEPAESTGAGKPGRSAKSAQPQARGQKAAPATGPELITAAGTYNLNSKQIELATLHARYPKTQISVDLQNPANFSYANGIELHNLNLDIKPRGSLAAEATIRPGTLSVQGKLDDLSLAVINTFAGTTLPPGQVDANLDLSSPSQGELELELHLDKKPLTRPSGGAGASVEATASSGSAEPAPSPALGNMDVDNSSKGNPDIILKANLGRSSGRLALTGDMDFRALTKMDDGAQANTATPDAIASTFTGTPAYGQIPPLTFSMPLALNSQGIPMPDMNGPFRANLAWMGEVAPLWQLVPMPDRNFSGLAAVNFNLTGSLNSPTFSGEAYIASGQFKDREFGVMLTDIKLEAHATRQKELRLILTATDGKKGKLGLEGSVNPSVESALNLRGRLEHLAPVHRDDLDLTITALVAVTGPLAQPDLQVQTIIESGEIVLLDSLMGGSVTTLPISNPDDAIEKTGQGLNLNVSVDIPRRFYIRGRGLDSEWKGKLNITGTSSAPEIRGSLNPVRGQFNLLSRNFNIEQGEIEFIGGTRINPGLNLGLIYSSSSLEAIIRIGGSLKNPNFSLESSPPLPQDEVLAQVLFGKNVSDLSRFEALQLASGLRTLTDGSGNGLDLLADIRETTGFDVLRVGSSGDSQQTGPQATGQSGSANLTPMGSQSGEAGQGDATLEAGKYLNDSIYIGVEKGISQESTAVRVEIELFPRISLQGTTSPSSSQVGIGWKKDY